MKWYAYRHNINKDIIEPYNIFNHGGFFKDVKDAAAKYDYDFSGFANEVRKALMYYFRSKAEWEVLISPWCGGRNSEERKIDIYDQVLMNWEVFITYLWENRGELRHDE